MAPKVNNCKGCKYMIKKGVKEFGAIDPGSMPDTGAASDTGITKPN